MTVLYNLFSFLEKILGISLEHDERVIKINEKDLSKPHHSVKPVFLLKSLKILKQ